MRKLAPLPVLLLLAGCGGGASSLGPAPKAKANAAPALQSPTPSQKQKALALSIWLVQGKGLVERHRAHAPTVRVATAAVEKLLAGPTQGERRGSGIGTAIPRGTRLIGIGIDKGIATVDLTSQFQAGGGSYSMQQRLGQVVYTLTQFPTVKKVKFELDGSPVDVFSSEGIVLDHPVGRGDYKNLIGDCAGYPASKQGFIAVTSPRPGGVVSPLAAVRGCSSTFEGTVNWNLKAKDGTQVASGFANGGSLQPGEFSFIPKYQLAKSEPGALEVYEAPASGEGHAVRRTVVPVQLAATR
jgi:Sporulation and spore germination/Immunoglobulin-like domain of bacterial spore germination